MQAHCEKLKFSILRESGKEQNSCLYYLKKKRERERYYYIIEEDKLKLTIDYLIYLLSIYIILFKIRQLLIKIFLCLHRILYSLILCKTVQFDSNEINVIQTRDFIK